MVFREQLAIRVRNRHRKRFWQEHDRETHRCDGCRCDYATAGFRWEVHHRDGDWLNGHPLNLVGICHRCHIATHRVQHRIADVGEWKDRFEGLSEGLSGSAWRGMCVGRKSAHHPDCAHGSCRREAETTVTHPLYGEHYVCGLHIVAAASGAENIDADGRVAVADGGDSA